tara:strand:- start:31903 stop:32199 length:297 start_codon:yes stop_codon:yes gene_type:complete
MTLNNTPYKKSSIDLKLVDGPMRNTGDVQMLIQTILECKDALCSQSKFSRENPRYLLFRTHSGHTSIDITRIVALTNRGTAYDIHLESGTIFTVGDVE